MLGLCHGSADQGALLRSLWMFCGSYFLTFTNVFCPYTFSPNVLVSKVSDKMKLKPGGRRIWSCLWSYYGDNYFILCSGIGVAVALARRFLVYHWCLFYSEHREAGEERNGWRIWTSSESANHSTCLSLLVFWGFQNFNAHTIVHF